ncbi:hemagglutinin repeat-containing protein, partial [Enterobacter asburiae]|uniref:hemagglutinin repeat-containing protein n=1 Tax=Enterobacter asburiae TaxID=61645 RepID=UPI001BDE4901
NNLWMQRDAAGNANSQVVNTSGNIETQNGDITVKTASLLNQRDGLTSTTTTSASPAYGWVGQATVDIPVSVLGIDTLVRDKYSTYTHEGSGTCGGVPCFLYEDTHYYYKPITGYETRQYALNQIAQVVNAEGGSARISSGRNLTITAAELNNQASAILANSNITLAGNTLNNQSYQSGTYTEYAVYKYVSPSYGGSFSGSYFPTHRNTYYDNDVTYVLDGHVTESENGETFRAVIQAGGNVTANFTSNISNTSTTANAGGVSNVISTPSLNSLSNQTIGSGVQKQGLSATGTVAVTSPQWNDRLQGALQQLNGGGALENGGASGTPLSNIGTTQKGNANLGQLGTLANAGVTTADLRTAQGGAVGHYQGQRVDTSAYPLPSGNNGYFVFSDNPKSPYLIGINPKLNGLGQLDPALFADLNAMLGIKPSSTAPQETRLAFTDEKQFLGSSYMLGRLNLNPDYDYRFLGDAAFDTRYVSNVVLNQTGNRYLNGIGSDLDQMRYLMDNAAAAQQSLDLQFGVSLTADQIAALDHSLLWWEKATVNGETVMVPKLYLSPKDVTVNNGSVIAGNNVTLKGGSITNGGSSLLAKNSLTLDSQNSISNLSNGLMKAGGDLNLSAIGDINNISSTISGKTVALESLDGSINNLTQVEQIDINAGGKYGNIGLKDTLLGNAASITAQDGLSLEAGKNITVTGANLSSGGDMLLNAWGDIAVNANQINDAFSSSREKTSRSSVTYQGSNVSAGGNLLVNAGHNLDVTASDLKAGGSAGLSAGNDLNLNAAQTSESSRKGKSESHSTGLDRTTISAGDNLVLKAGQDINAQAAALASEKSVGLQAGRDVNLAAEETTQGDSYRSGKKTVINESVRQQGTEIASGANTQILAGRDVNTEAAQVTAKGDIGVAAGRDVSLNTATESDYHYKEQTKTKKGFLSKKTTHTIEEDSATRESGSLLSGDNVQVVAGNNLRVFGSAVAGDGDVQLKAGNNVDIVAATNSDTSWRFKEEKKSGLMGSGGIGFTIGSSKSTHDLREKGTTQSQSFSTVGSTGGNVAISAGNQAHVGGADLIAGKDLSLSGDSVIIEPGHDRRTRDETFEQKKSGLTVALSGTVGSAINNAVSAAQETKEQSDGRLKALQATKTVLSGVQAGQAADMAATTGDPNAMGVSLSLTTQKSKSQQHAESDAVAGSTLNAGNNLSITANGKNKGANSGDIVIAGSQLKAGGDTTLDAQNDILLSGAANTQKTSGKNSSSGGGIGVSIGAGGNGAGISVFANVNAAHGKDKGNGTDWTETTIDSGKNVTLKSGHDTVLDGAQVNGNKIVADVGHDLLMRSQQNNSDYDSKQTSVAAGGSFTFGTMSGSGYINASQDKMKSRFDSVAEQTGLYAGDGGFDITVGHHTQLDGAVITSTATPDKNSLDTGTLGFSDIHNEADFKTSHSGISLSGGGSFGDKFQGNLPGGMISAAGNKGHKEGTTQAAVAEGSLTIRDKANQKQDVAELSRDTEHANDSISPIFDKEKEQNRLNAVGMISDIGSQVADIARTQGDLNGLKAAQKETGATLPANATEKQRQDYLAKLRDTQAYKNVMVTYGTGSDMQRGIQAATAALQGLAGGNIGGALAGASAPELANIIGHHAGIDDNTAAKAIAHAILGGVTAALQGNSAAAGAVGAASGELIATAIARQFYPDTDPSKLTEEQKQTVSTLASVSAGIAGGIAGGNTAGAAAGASAGKNSVENNFLGATSSDKLDKAIEKIKQGDRSLAAANDVIKLENADKRSDALMDKFRRDPSSLSESERTELSTYVRVYAAEMQNIYGADRAKEMVQNLFAYPGYERNPDNGVLNQAQSIVNTWGYHESNASIGDAPLMFGSSVLGITIREGMAVNAAIGTAVNTGFQLSGNEPFSYVDAIMAGVASAATTGKGWKVSAAINMGGAAIGSAIKGEDPTNSVISTGFGSLAGSLGGKVVDSLSPVADQVTKDVIGAVTGSTASEFTGKVVKDELDKREKKQ